MTNPTIQVYVPETEMNGAKKMQLVGKTFKLYGNVDVSIIGV